MQSPPPIYGKSREAQNIQLVAAIRRDLATQTEPLALAPDITVADCRKHADGERHDGERLRRSRCEICGRRLGTTRQPAQIHARDPRPQLCHTTRGRHRSQSAVTSEGVRSASPFALMPSCERQPDHRRAVILRQTSHAREEDATRRHDRPFQGRARVPVARRRAMLGGQR